MCGVAREQGARTVAVGCGAGLHSQIRGRAHVTERCRLVTMDGGSFFAPKSRTVTQKTEPTGYRGKKWASDPAPLASCKVL